MSDANSLDKVSVKDLTDGRREVRLPQGSSEEDEQKVMREQQAQGYVWESRSYGAEQTRDELTRQETRNIGGVVLTFKKQD